MEGFARISCTPAAGSAAGVRRGPWRLVRRTGRSGRRARRRRAEPRPVGWGIGGAETTGSNACGAGFGWARASKERGSRSATEPNRAKMIWPAQAMSASSSAERMRSPWPRGTSAAARGVAGAWGRAAAVRCQARRSARREFPAECWVTALVILVFQPEPEPPVHLNRPNDSGFDLAGRRERPRGVIRPLAGARGDRKDQSSKDVGRRASRECAGPNTGGGCNWVRADRKKRSMFPFDQAWSGVAGSRRRPRCGVHDARVLAAKRGARWSRCFSHNLRPCASSAPATGERG